MKNSQDHTGPQDTPSNPASNQGLNDLFGSVSNGQLERVTSILEDAVHPDSVTQEGKTALIKACEQGSVGMTELLLTHHAHPNHRGTKVTSDMNQRNLDGKSALHYANDTTIIKALFKHLADPIADKTKLLHSACLDDNTVLAKALLDAGADPNTDKILLLAIALKHDEIVKLLLEAGANPNTVSTGETALKAALVACRISGNAKMFERLLAAGANPDYQDDQGKTVADYAHSYGLPDKTIVMLETASANKTQQPDSQAFKNSLFGVSSGERDEGYLYDDFENKPVEDHKGGNKHDDIFPL